MTGSDKPLSGKVALVTGAAQGIGEAIANRFMEAGATLALADMKEVETWSHTLAHTGSNSGHVVDITSSDACNRLVEEVVDQHGRLDILINNAGIVSRGPAEAMSDEDFCRVIDVNVSGTFRMSRASFSHLKATSGSIVNIGSTSGKLATMNTVSYCTSKAAIHQLTSALALEWGRHNVRVNAVGPIIVPTEMNAVLRASEMYMKEKMARIPLQRMAEAEDIANCVLFLASNQAAMITGQTVFVDGGATFN